MQLQELVRIRDAAAQALGRCGEWVSRLGLLIGCEVGVARVVSGRNYAGVKLPRFHGDEDSTRSNGLATVPSQDFGPAAGLCHPKCFSFPHSDCFLKPKESWRLAWVTWSCCCLGRLRCWCGACAASRFGRWDLKGKAAATGGVTWSFGGGAWN